MKNKWRVFALVLVGIILAFTGLVMTTGMQCCNSAPDEGIAALVDQRPSDNEAAVAAGPERIGVYSVPLRCPLVMGLGCGSESKPIMTRLEGNSAVAGAWLNHAGTTLAVFWKEDTDTTQRFEVIVSSFQNHSQPNELSGEPRELALKDFLSGTGWYRTAALDELSKEEAEIVATRWVEKITAVIPLPERAREALRCRISDKMRRRFVGK